MRIVLGSVILLFSAASMAPLSGGNEPRSSKPPEPQPLHAWVARPDHSSIEFRTSHWGIVDIIGWFEEFTVTFSSDSLSWRTAAITGSVRTTSVRMPNPAMANNLRGMLETQEYPEAVFKSSAFQSVTEDSFQVSGLLTLHGITAPLTLVGRVNGYVYDPEGTVGLTLHGNLNRFRFALGDSSRTSRSGHFDLNEVIRVTCNLRLEYASHALR